MDLSQPVSVVLAFAAGFGFMLCTRLIWSLLSYSFYAAILFGGLLMLGQNGVIHLEDLKDSTAARYAKGGLESVAAAAAGAKSWISKHEITVHIAQRGTDETDASLD